MNTPSFLQKLYLPFFSGDYYRHVVKNNKGFGLKTLFAVLTLNWVFTLVIMGIGFFRIIGDVEFTTTKDAILKQVPVITVKDGKVSIDEPTPYVITMPDSEEPLVVFATAANDQITEEMQRAPVLVTQDEIVINKNTGEARSYKFAEWEDTTLDAAALEAFGYTIFWITIPILLVFMVGGSYLFRLLQVFVFAGFGQIFNAIFNTRLAYDQMCRLTGAALTPVLLLDVGLFYIWSGPKLWFFNFFLAMAFLGFGVSSQKVSPSDSVNFKA